MTKVLLTLSLVATVASAWVTAPQASTRRSTLLNGFLHGESSCFMPLDQLDQDYYAPRILQVCCVASRTVALRCVGLWSVECLPCNVCILTLHHITPPTFPLGCWLLPWHYCRRSLGRN